jgi:signal peptidase
MNSSSGPRKLLKNEWVRTGILIVIVLVAFFSLWFSIRTALGTDYPLLAVASGSMVPTLNVGDLIIVHGVSNYSEIYTHYGNGDIIVFHTYEPGGPNLQPGRSDELIVHRAINKTLRYDSYTGKEVWFFTTKGDNNPVADPGTILTGPVPEYYVVGKVVGSIPYVGNVPLFIRTPTGFAAILVLIILVICAEFVYSAYKEKQKLPAEAQS